MTSVSAPSTFTSTPIPTTSSSSSSSSSSTNPPITRSSISLALVCQSNLNRSMEAHDRMQKNGILCSSYGAGTKVRLPGEAINRPNVYEFGTPYEDIYQDLVQKNQARYSKNGMLQMVARDRRVKHAPERWQLTNKHYDVVITYEYRVYETVIADLESRASDWHRPCHVINIDTTDNHQEAVTGATLTLQFVNKLYDHSDWCDRITTILDQFEKEHQKEMAHTIMFE